MSQIGQIQPRRALMKKLVKGRVIKSQVEMLRLLHEEGFNPTQSTLSRDFQELDIKKNVEGRYVLGKHREQERQEELLKQLLLQEVDVMPTNPKMFFIRTRNESATMLGHLLKSVYKEKVMDCLAMGNTLIVLTDGENKKFRKELRELMEGVKE